MNIIVLTVRQHLQSASKLEYTVSTKLPFNTEYYDNTIIIRWGNSFYQYNKYQLVAEYKNVINPAQNIRSVCRHKDIASLNLSTVVKTPKLWFNGMDIPADKKVVYRPIKHSKGSDFQIRNGDFIVEPDHYATEYINADKEFRIWFIENNYLIAQRVPRKEDIRSAEGDCRSNWGYYFIKKSPFNKLKEQTAKVAKLFSLHFGALDVLFKDNEYYFLECNTAPALDFPIVENFFKTHLKNLINKITVI